MGRNKGVVKAHVMIHATELMPMPAHVNLGLPEGSYVDMDKGYTDYYEYAAWSQQQIYYIQPNER